MTSQFVTSKGFALPTTESEMGQSVWFNMWQRLLWPYQELQEGDTLYWFDTTEQAIIWRSRVQAVERFDYANKEMVREWLRNRFGHDPLNDPYFIRASDKGHCLAYKVDSLRGMRVPKPSDYRFPQGGWLRMDDEGAQEWLAKLRSVEQADGPSTEGLAVIAATVSDEGYFSPANLKDEHERRLREIIERRGQPDFRNNLVAAYNGRCAVTGCDAVAALEAAHIIPYCGPDSNHVTNGLLLRSDIHTLFDLDLIGFDPETLMAALAPALRCTSYAELQGKPLRLPEQSGSRPNAEALAQRWQRFSVG